MTITKKETELYNQKYITPRKLTILIRFYSLYTPLLATILR